MNLSRRDLLRAGGVATFAALTTSACGSSAGSSGSSSGTSLWYWGGGLSDKVVAAAAQQFPEAGLKASVIGGDFKQKLQTTLAGGRFIPTITGVKGEDMPYFRSVGNKFVDLGPLGASSLASSGLEWKWKQAQTDDGKQIGYPIDVGPTAMFYRADIFEQAGLPSDPDQVSAAITTWDAFYEVGQQLHGKVPTAFPVSQLATVWDMVTGQTTQRFISQDGKFVGDSDEMRQAWDTTVKAQTLGLNANASQSLNQALSSGAVAAEPGAAWHALDISQGAPDTSGKWRVAKLPVKATNLGGSFLTIPAATKDTKSAYEIISWILSPDNEAQGFTDAAIFPADPQAWTLPALTGGDAFFGGQKTIDIFGPAAKEVPSQYEAAADAAVAAPYKDQLSLVETSSKDPDQAWKDAVSAAQDVFTRQGGTA